MKTLGQLAALVPLIHFHNAKKYRRVGRDADLRIARRVLYGEFAADLDRHRVERRGVDWAQRLPGRGGRVPQHQTGRARRGDIHDRLEAEADSFHERVREHFLELAESAPGRYVVLDAAADPAWIAAAVLAAVDALLDQTGAASDR